MTGSLEALAIATFLFVGGHVVLSWAPVRGQLVAVVGEQWFPAVYSVLVGAAFAWMAFAYGAAPFVEVWNPPIGLRHIALTVMPLAFILFVGSVTTPNPSLAGVPSGAIAERGPVGFLKITRHPMLWAFGLWGLCHLLANGDAASMVMFGGLTALALGGAAHIDARKRAKLGSAWEVYAAQTSYLPFQAMIQGRTKLAFSEIGWWRIGLGVLLYAIVLFAHEWAFGVTPLPL